VISSGDGAIRQRAMIRLNSPPVATGAPSPLPFGRNLADRASGARGHRVDLFTLSGVRYAPGRQFSVVAVHQASPGIVRPGRAERRRCCLRPFLCGHFTAVGNRVTQFFGTIFGRRGAVAEIHPIASGFGCQHEAKGS
jgi:hypothetical protein